MMTEAEAKHATRPMSHEAILKEYEGIDEKMGPRNFSGMKMKYMGTFHGYVRAVGASFGFFYHLRPKVDSKDAWRVIKVLLKGDKKYRYRLYMRVK